MLLFDAIKRIANAAIASHAILVDAIDDDAVKFYREWHFVSLSADNPHKMYLTVATALKAIEG